MPRNGVYEESRLLSETLKCNPLISSSWVLHYFLTALLLFPPDQRAAFRRKRVRATPASPRSHPGDPGSSRQRNAGTGLTWRGLRRTKLRYWDEQRHELDARSRFLIVVFSLRYSVSEKACGQGRSTQRRPRPVLKQALESGMAPVRTVRPGARPGAGHRQGPGVVHSPRQ